jgi:N-acetylmuramoyl-L-alanine amidase CwlA
MCHPKADGRFNAETYVSAVDLVASLCARFKLDPERDIWRHYDVTGKLCPKWLVENPEAFGRFKLDASLAMEEAEEWS